MLRRYRSADLPWLVALLVAFAASRVLACRAGLRFDALALSWFVQIPRTDLLRDRLAETLLYLHAQPPAFSALIGAVLKSFPFSRDEAFAWIYRAFGVLLTFGMYAVFRQVGFARSAACIAAALFALSPEALLYENWLMYSYPVAAFLVAACASVGRYVDTGRWSHGITAFSLTAVPVLTRATYHAVWMFLVVAIVASAVRFRGRRRAVLYAAAAPLAIVLALLAKNATLFGQLTSSSWIGMNLARIVTSAVPEDDRRALVRQGRISDLALVRPFAPLGDYPAYKGKACVPDVPILSEEDGNSGPNLNNCAYLAISAQYRRDALALIRLFPRTFLRSMGTAWGLFIQPVTENSLVRGQKRDKIAAYADWFEKWVLVQPIRWSPAAAPANGDFMYAENIGGVAYRWAHATAGILLVAAIGIVSFGGASAWRVFRGRGDSRSAVILFAAATCVFSAVVSNALERGENNRFRMEIEPLLFVMAALVVERGGVAVARRFGRLRRAVMG